MPWLPRAAARGRISLITATALSCLLSFASTVCRKHRTPLVVRESICLNQAPIVVRERAYASTVQHSSSGRERMPRPGTNRRQGESVCLDRAPIVVRERVYASTGHQSSSGRECMPRPCTNRSQGESVCLDHAPILVRERAYASTGN
eukprot:8764539-Pyramimonas_sp.AAC.1